MRTILWVGLALVAGLGTASAEDYTDPGALVSAIYATFQPGTPKGDPAVYYSARLKLISEEAAAGAIFASDAAMSGSQFTPDPVFNPFLPDDNALLFDLAIGTPQLLDDRAIVSVSFHNFDQPHLLALSLIREGGVWKVDDVASLGSETPWLLSWALTLDPYGL